MLIIISFFFNDPSTTEIYTLSLHDALPILFRTKTGELSVRVEALRLLVKSLRPLPDRSEEHTSELQSRFDLVCRLLLEKKKNVRSPRNLGVTDLLRSPALAVHRHDYYGLSF